MTHLQTLSKRVLSWFTAFADAKTRDQEEEESLRESVKHHQGLTLKLGNGKEIEPKSYLGKAMALMANKNDASHLETAVMRIVDKAFRGQQHISGFDRIREAIEDKITKSPRFWLDKYMKALDSHDGNEEIAEKGFIKYMSSKQGMLRDLKEFASDPTVLKDTSHPGQAEDPTFDKASEGQTLPEDDAAKNDKLTEAKKTTQSIAAQVSLLDKIISETPGIAGFNTKDLFLKISNLTNAEYSKMVTDLEKAKDHCDLKHLEECVAAIETYKTKFYPKFTSFFNALPDENATEKLTTGGGGKELIYFKMIFNGDEDKIKQYNEAFRSQRFYQNMMQNKYNAAKHIKNGDHEKAAKTQATYEKAKAEYDKISPEVIELGKKARNIVEKFKAFLKKIRTEFHNSKAQLTAETATRFLVRFGYMKMPLSRRGII